MPIGIYKRTRKIRKNISKATKKLFKNPKNHPRYIDGKWLKQYYCKKCKKKISKNSGIRGSGLCMSCIQKDKHLSKKTREKMSKAKTGIKFSNKHRRNMSKAKKGRKNGMFGKIPSHSKWGTYKSIKMRSSYEIVYAKYLDKNKIKWNYEPEAFDLGSMTYRPDFYLPEKDLYIEIKGWWREDVKKKFKRFRKKYPKVKIKLLMKKDLQELKILKN